MDDWSPALIAVERFAKETAAILLMVIGNETRAVASMGEACEFICRGRVVVLVLQDLKPDTVFDGQRLNATEIKDLNRGRAYLRETAERQGTQVFITVEDAVRRSTAQRRPKGWEDTW